MTDTAKTVVITGASAGIGRAAARCFAARGDRVALLARGRTGLAAAAEEVRAAGGTALEIPTDVADYEAVDAAATRVEDELGAIDVWVNSAFTSVFAPFEQIDPEEFRRVTEVTYLGSVHGIRAALLRMRARDRGAIVQVGSALGDRSIPLQSAYCGAKHAVNGLVEAVRVELLHEHSNVHITVVQAPAVNTPQFSWVLSRLPRKPQPVPPIYQPEVVARTLVFAADHPRHKQYWVGASTVGTVLAQRLAPRLLDHYLARTGYGSQQTDAAARHGANNLWTPLDGPDGIDYGAHGEFNGRAHAHSPQAWLARALTSLGRSGKMILLAASLAAALFAGGCANSTAPGVPGTGAPDQNSGGPTVTADSAKQLCDMISPHIDTWRSEDPGAGRLSLNSTVQDWALRNNGVNFAIMRNRSLIDTVMKQQCPDVHDAAVQALRLPDLASGLAGF
ncbi:hypothetical protein JMUB6875_32530 [Nocardia sp. JMUB6875]